MQKELWCGDVRICPKCMVYQLNFSWASSQDSRESSKNTYEYPYTALQWSDMSKPGMLFHWINYWLSNHKGLDRRLLSYQPVKPTWKNWPYVENIANEL